jgi:hypothetical protein
MLDAFTMARLRRFADPYAAFPMLPFGAAPSAPPTPARMPQPWTWQSDVFATIDEAAALAPALTPADAAFSLPRGEAFPALDFGEPQVADAPWHLRQPFEFGPIEGLARRLDPYRQPAMTSNAPYGASAGALAAQRATSLDPTMLARLARYRGAGPAPALRIEPQSRYSESTREKIGRSLTCRPSIHRRPSGKSGQKSCWLCSTLALPLGAWPSQQDNTGRTNSSCWMVNLRQPCS